MKPETIPNENLMKVVLVRPGKRAEIAHIGTKLEDMQKVVGGYIQAVYPYEDEVAIVCNEEGKLNGLQPNRALADDNGDAYDIIFGTFFICGLSEDNFASLTSELAQKYRKLFEYPDHFYVNNGQLIKTKR